MHVQDGSHSSVEDAQATMALYRSVQREWEASLRLRFKQTAGKATGADE